jgi:hypothetical protein
VRLKNVSPQGAMDIPMLGRIVEPGEEFEVPDEDAHFFVGQDEMFAPILSDLAAAARSAADAVAAQAANSAAASSPPADNIEPATTQGETK